MVVEWDALTAVDLAARSADQKAAWTDETMVVSLVVCSVDTRAGQTDVP